MKWVANFVVVTAVLLLVVSTVSAAVIRVNSEVPGVRDFYMDETAVSRHVPDEYNTIQDGINAASWGDTIIVGDGTYTGIPNKNLSFFGKLLHLVSENGPETCVIDCENSGRGVNLVTWEPVESTIQGFTIKNGGSTGIEGGGMKVENASATVIDCILEQNTGSRGGGIICRNGTLVLRETVFSNSVANIAGGAIYSENATVMVDTCRVQGSSASSVGGGIYSDNCTINVVNCIIDSNSSDHDGGGIFLREGTAIIDNCEITDNLASYDGGGIYSDMSSSRIMNCIISGNVSFRNGGGIRIFDGRIDNCLISENIAYLEGGGLRMYGYSVVSNSTIVWNAGLVGCGGIYSGASPLITNCVLWNDSPCEICDRGTAEYRYCNILHGWPGEGNINLNPMFVSGPLGDYYLSQTATGHSEDSPCVDAGSGQASEICFETYLGTTCMNQYTTRTDHVLDSGLVDMGFHFIPDTPVATPPATPTVLPTATPSADCQVTGVELWMPAHAYYPGDPCSCIVSVCNNTGASLSDHPLFVILDIHGMLIFAPGFTETPDNYGDIYPDFPEGLTDVTVLDEFMWPENVGSQSGIIWYAAMTNPEMTDLMGEWDSFTFGWAL